MLHYLPARRRDVQVSDEDLVAGNDRLLQRDDLVRTRVRMPLEVGPRIREEDAVRSSASKLATHCRRGRERDNIEDGQTSFSVVLRKSVSMMPSQTGKRTQAVASVAVLFPPWQTRRRMSATSGASSTAIPWRNKSARSVLLGWLGVAGGTGKRVRVGERIGVDVDVDVDIVCAGYWCRQ